MLRDRSSVALSLLAAIAAWSPSAAIAGDTSAAAIELAQEAPPPGDKKWMRRNVSPQNPPAANPPAEQEPPPAKTKQAPPPPPAATEQRVEPKKERLQRQQERVREQPDRSQKLRERMQQIQQKQQEQQQRSLQQQQERSQKLEQRRQQIQERLQQKQEADRLRKERQLQERARQKQPQTVPQPDLQVKERNTAPGVAHDGDRRRPDRRENSTVANPPPSRDTQPAVLPPPTREVDRASPRDDNRRRIDRRDGAPTGVPPPSTYPAGGGQPAIKAPPVREEARRAVGRESVRESYRRAPGQQRSFDDLKRNRRERTISQGNLRVIEEPDRRVIVKQNNRTFIRHDESERFRRIAPDARTIKRADGTSTTFMTRSGGVRIYDVTDRNGRLLHRYRRYPNGREVILIDNRRHYSRDKSRTRDVLIGAGIGLFIGSAIALAAPEIRIPRDEYIVDYGRASDDDLYEALTAPPIERLDRGYSLDEIRYSAPLRDRMRRIDLDTVTFDFGSWEVGPDQGRALDRLADGINRVLQKNPDEIFMIEGHTDAVGSEDDNLTLSDRRAQSVAEILTTEYGVAPENLVTQGYGEEQLKIPTDGPERLNRRITVRRIGPLLSGQFEEERYSGASPVDDRADDRARGYEDLDDGPPDDGLPAVVPPDDGRTYDYDNDRYR
ncbi:MAG: flagellar motor protein MotB [Hyphomicrobium sp.]|nr:MAG: flagellar motor protein MotB [Hyphomicrobium sp.]